MKKEDLFNQILSDNSDRIQRICRYYNSNAEDQKDMYQEVLINIWKSLDQFKGKSAISTWVYRVAVNTSLSFTGKSYREMQLIINTDTQNLSSILDNEDLEIKRKEEKQFNQLQNELNMLSVIDKALISLMLEGLSMREIADVIGINEPNVKVKIHRIKTQLKNKLTGGKHELK
ncbi:MULTISPECIES: RNA polymerase sigma factor [Marinifilum]|uniref:RNA polymerase sigma-70 factor (ECF subfamily) n=1 Tax=Marinifilum flexuosum TaxID=1117708 RepID=A0A419WT07_9BACT|nr:MULTISPECIES: RNA polymerase sigma factor [Marinifilum]RKD98614.1 RNA polymerase sigma-70 factor (ECF subfamily) [Marinifilum flexuosum]